MKHFYLAFWLTIYTFSISAQTTIFLFDWEGTDPKQAAIGPNAASIGASALTKLRADNNTKGLAASVGAGDKLDIVMVLTNNPIFNLAGIDLSFDYSSDETTATVFSRNNFKMLVNGSNVTYRVTNTDGSCSAPITSGTQAIVKSNVYNRYRFVYDPNTGNAVLSINGTTQFTNPTKTPGQALCWTGDTDITVGVAMDGSGTGKALLDNMRMEDVAFNSSLPVELTYFEAEPVDDEVDFKWQTASENDNDYFSVERSGADSEWVEVARREGLGNSNDIYVYEATDTDPLPGINYYRLKQVDFDGRHAYSSIRSVIFDATVKEVSAYPNPTDDFVYLRGSDISAPTVKVYDQQGRLLPVLAEPYAGGYRLDLRHLAGGAYFINNGRKVTRVMKR